MQAPHMLYLQESSSINSSRLFRTHSLAEALDIMMKLFAEIKLKSQNCKATVFDIEEALNYYESVFEVRFFEQVGGVQASNHFLDNIEAKNMRIYNRKMLLDLFVDRLASPPNPEAIMRAEE